MTVLARMEGVDTIMGDAGYKAGSQWVRENGISDGNNMDGTITRERLATMFMRFIEEIA